MFGGQAALIAQGVAVGPEMLVAVGFEDDLLGEVDAAAWTSPDGLTWSRVADREVTFGGDGLQRMEAVVAGDSLFVAVGHDLFGEGADTARSDFDAAVWTSPDGLDWTRVPHDETVFGGPPITAEEAGNLSEYVGFPTFQKMLDITTGGPGFVAVGWDDAAAAVWTSADGLSWSRVTGQADELGDRSPAIGPERVGEGAMWGVTEADGRLVAVGGKRLSGVAHSAAAWTSDDGLAWTRVPNEDAVFGSDSEFFRMNDVVAGGPGFVAVGTEVAQEAAAQAELAEPDRALTTRPLVVGALGPAIWTSEDGLTWSRIRLFETPGHSAGHCSLLVEATTGARGMLLGFDVAYTQAALEKEIQPAFHFDPVAGQRSITRLKQLATEHAADVFLGHDAEAWRGYRRAPQFYEL